MKKSTVIASHLCIFALGASIAYNSTKDSRASANHSSAAQGSGTPSPATSPHGSTEDDANSVRQRRPRGDTLTRNAITTGETPSETLGKIGNIKDSYERQRAMMEFFDRLTPDQFAGVADEFQKLNHYGDSRGGMNLLFRAWAKTDPVAALAYIDKNPDTGRNRGSVLESWAGTDPTRAEQWAVEKHKGDGPNPYLVSVISGIAPHDIGKASELTQSMPASRERGQAIEALTRALLMNGTDVALAYPDSIQDEQLKGSFVSIISRMMADKDPEAAAAWITSLDSGAVQNRASSRVAQELAAKDVNLAKKFVTSLKPEARADAARPIVRALSNSDIAGAAQWVSGLVGTPGYDRVVEEFVWSSNGRAPEQSAAWIQGIAEQGRQRHVYHRMLGEWARRDANAVRAWVAENNVPPDIQRRFSR